MTNVWTESFLNPPPTRQSVPLEYIAMTINDIILSNIITDECAESF